MPLLDHRLLRPQLNLKAVDRARLESRRDDAQPTPSSGHCAELERQFGVASLALFGSVARDEAGPDSDVDVLVEFRETPGLSEYMRLKWWLEERLERRVDLVMKGALKAWARPVVEAEAIVVS